MIIARNYQGAQDLSRLQAFNAAQIARNPSGWLQTGDIPHRIYNTQRKHPPESLIQIWENPQGEILGWAFVFPLESFELQSANPEVLRAALEWVESRLEADCLEMDLWDRDDPRAEILLAAGYTPADEPPYCLRARSLLDPLPAYDLPPGFSIRRATGIEDAAGLAAVHAGAFGSDWTAETYAKVMQSPGYAAEREWVVVAPGGQFAAFCVTWYDDLNQTGYFEPVGTHQDFHRQGLGRALMSRVLAEMKGQGLQKALVMHEPPEENPAAAALYTSLGFEVIYQTYLHQKDRA